MWQKMCDQVLYQTYNVYFKQRITKEFQTTNNKGINHLNITVTKSANSLLVPA
jgi:hypothetical protein